MKSSSEAMVDVMRLIIRLKLPSQQDEDIYNAVKALEQAAYLEGQQSITNVLFQDQTIVS